MSLASCLFEEIWWYTRKPATATITRKRKSPPRIMNLRLSLLFWEIIRSTVAFPTTPCAGIVGPGTIGICPIGVDGGTCEGDAPIRVAGVVTAPIRVAGVVTGIDP